jgi:hypothetical protein
VWDVDSIRKNYVGKKAIDEWLGKKASEIVNDLRNYMGWTFKLDTIKYAQTSHSHMTGPINSIPAGVFKFLR